MKPLYHKGDGKVEPFSVMAHFPSTVSYLILVFDYVKGALCSFGDNISIRRERSSLTISFITPK